MLVMDIENSSGRPEYVRARLQDDASALMDRALYEAGLAVGEYTVDERGDGALIVLPPDASKSRITDVFAHRLPLWLRRLAGQRSELARLRLRIGLNCGDASVTDQGSWLGTAVDTLFRLVDAAPTKQALAAASDALMVLIVSDAWYADAVRPGLGDTFEDDFRPLTIASHGRDFPAWLTLPGISSRETAEDSGDSTSQDPTRRTSADAAASFEDLRVKVLLPAAQSGEADAHEAAADKLRILGAGEHAAPVRRLLREWAAADDPGLRATAAYALGRRAGQIEPAEAGALLTALAPQPHTLVAAAVTRACVLAAAGEAADDPRGMWVFRMLEGWIGHRDGRVRRAAGRALMALAADLEREGDPRAAALEYAIRAREQEAGTPSPASSDSATAARNALPAHGLAADSSTHAPDQTGDPGSAEPRNPAGRPGPGAPEEGPAPWPGLVWFGEIDPQVGRSVAALWRAALVSPEFAMSAGRALDLYAQRVEPYPERREALVRLAARTAAGRERARGTVVLRARRWVRRPEAGAPLTGSLLLAVLDPVYAAARIDAAGHADADSEAGGRPPPARLRSARNAHRAQRHRERNTNRPPSRIQGRNPNHDHRCR